MATSPHTHDPKAPIHEKTAGEAVQDSVMGTDREMGDDHPAAPAAWVFGTYPAVLLIAALLALLFFVTRPTTDGNKPNNSVDGVPTSSSPVQQQPLPSAESTGAQAR